MEAGMENTRAVFYLESEPSSPVRKNSNRLEQIRKTLPRINSIDNSDIPLQNGNTWENEMMALKFDGRTFRENTRMLRRQWSDEIREQVQPPQKGDIDGGLAYLRTEIFKLRKMDEELINTFMNLHQTIQHLHKQRCRIGLGLPCSLNNFNAYSTISLDEEDLRSPALPWSPATPRSGCNQAMNFRVRAFSVLDSPQNSPVFPRKLMNATPVTPGEFNW